eukprot:TRINITY_DN4064_c0_g1_i2.p1 TRINITY_DN4064_c0_g1~~TRINITY_DN4064_c0_g1_i2.p1  ORF type:complete len:203 (+),score=33.11 TRINITY_DN4064_c0_g1_i2:82-609(+)
MLEWYAVIFGPAETPYEGGIFEVRISFPPDYPFKPPRAYFVTRCYHPNIKFHSHSFNSSYKVPILAPGAWSPTQNITKLLRQSWNLLRNPHVDEPALVEEILVQLKRDPKEFVRQARDWAIRYADAPLPCQLIGPLRERCVRRIAGGTLEFSTQVPAHLTAEIAALRALLLDTGE